MTSLPGRRTPRAAVPQPPGVGRAVHSRHQLPQRAARLQRPHRQVVRRRRPAEASRLPQSGEGRPSQ